jgi:hypothetical protein
MRRERSLPATRLCFSPSHYAIFASAAATGTGIAIATDQVAHHSNLTHFETALCLTVPVSVYLTVAWALHVPYKPPSLFRNWSVPVAVVLILASSATSQPVLVTGILLIVLLALTLVFRVEKSNVAVDEPAIEPST